VAVAHLQALVRLAASSLKAAQLACAPAGFGSSDAPAAGCDHAPASGSGGSSDDSNRGANSHNGSPTDSGHCCLILEATPCVLDAAQGAHSCSCNCRGTCSRNVWDEGDLSSAN
jgi:hypothetical protein